LILGAYLSYTPIPLNTLLVIRMEYWVLAFYSLVELEEPHNEVGRHKEFFKTRDLTSRIYISCEGINAQMSGKKEHVQEYMDWLKSDPRHANVSFKIHTSLTQEFPRATIKYRKQLVSMGTKVDLSNGGKHVNPAEWKEMLENKDENTILIDVRNDYEWKVGHFEGAVLPEIETFREFPGFAKDLKKEKDPKKTKVMMYCTGGIRCEYYSAVMKEEGFDEVYQLGGGVIQYGLDEGQSKWKGKLFVFDDRLVIPISDEAAPPISVCRHCQKPTDTYYNCANMDCNDLFISCKECIKEMRGCCEHECQFGRVRPIREGGDPRPYRKCSHDEKLRLQKAEC
jgi:UPF0176 protein